MTGVNGVPAPGLWLCNHVSRENADENMNTCVHVDVGLEGKPWARERVTPVSGILIENQLVISDRPSLHTTDIVVDEGPIKDKPPSRPIVEGRPEGEYCVLKPGIRGGIISTGPTSEEEWILVSADGALHGNEPFFPPVSVRWKLGGVSRGSGDVVREVRSSGPRTVVDDCGDFNSMLWSGGWTADDEGEESRQDEQSRQRTHVVEEGRRLGVTIVLPTLP